MFRHSIVFLSLECDVFVSPTSIQPETDPKREEKNPTLFELFSKLMLDSINSFYHATALHIAQAPVVSQTESSTSKSTPVRSERTTWQRNENAEHHQSNQGRVWTSHGSEDQKTERAGHRASSCFRGSVFCVASGQFSDTPKARSC